MHLLFPFWIGKTVINSIPGMFNSSPNLEPMTLKTCLFHLSRESLSLFQSSYIALQYLNHSSIHLDSNWLLLLASYWTDHKWLSFNKSLSQIDSLLLQPHHTAMKLLLNQNWEEKSLIVSRHHLNSLTPICSTQQKVSVSVLNTSPIEFQIHVLVLIL